MTGGWWLVAGVCVCAVHAGGRQRFLTEPSAPNQLSAAWCLTNVATGSHEQTLETLKAAPFLINFLTSGDPVSNSPVRTLPCTHHTHTHT